MPFLPRIPLATALLCVVMVASACSGGGDSTGTGQATLVDTAAVCSADAVRSALQLAEGDGAEAAMADTPVGTAAANNPLLGALADALVDADLLGTLDAAESVTVFAPTDCAFAMADPATIESALADPGLLTQVLGLHVIPGPRLSSDQLDGRELEALTGRMVSVQRQGDDLVVDGRATVIVGDIQTANATVHLIDTVLTPAGNGSAESSTPEVPAAGPTESSRTCDTGALVAAIAGGPEEGTVEGMADDPVAVAAGNNRVLTALVDALAEAQLTDTLNGADALTVFAPTDCAFAQLDPSFLDRAAADPGGLLAQILQFHVVPGQRLSFDQLTGGELDTLNGRLLPYTAADNVVTLNGQARIVLPNIQTANATVHLIDTVMIPPVE